MKAVATMIAASLAAAMAAIAIAGRGVRADVLLGMLAPLGAAGLSWVLVERTFKRDPQQLTALMISGFVAKMLFFGAYVAVMLEVVGVRPVPFVVSFTAYFIALYLTEALLMRRLFAGG
jgi:predicted permease